VRAAPGAVRTIAAFVLAVLVLGGAAIVLFDLAAPRTAIVVAGLLVLVIVLRLFGDILLPWVFLFVGAAVVAAFSLLAVNWAWAWVGMGRVEPAWVGVLFVALPVVFFSLWAYFGTWWAVPARDHAWIWSALTSFVLVVVLPFGVVWVKTRSDDEEPVPDQVRVLSQLNMGVIAADGAPDLPGTARMRGWQIQLSRGRPQGTGIDWGGDGKPRWQDDGADPVLVLLVDGAPATLEDAKSLPDVRGDPDEVERWMAIADAAAPEVVPTYVLLQTRDQARLERWRAELGSEDEDPDAGRLGQVISLQARAGNRTVVDVALAAAVDAPTFEEDLALASRHRPLLYFDEGEKTYTPLNVDRLLEKGKFRLCPVTLPTMLSLCGEVNGSSDLKSGGNNLGFETGEVAAETEGSTIYVNVTHRVAGRRERAYLDYWWYLPDNPTGAAGGALCGAGFVIAGWTCFDHQSDWEGVTVVTERRTPAQPYEPIAVHYSAHEGRTRFTWPVLEMRWKERGTRKVAGDVTGTVQPLVFIAQGTHAAYPTACHTKRCDKGPAALNENRHNGGRPWDRNSDTACNLTCLTALPERRGGSEPALWSAFEGRWGTTECDLMALCSSSDAPKSPGHQDRYRRPWCAAATVTLQDGRPRLVASVPLCDETAPVG
jgi:hypothetical protein